MQVFVTLVGTSKTHLWRGRPELPPTHMMRNSIGGQKRVNFAICLHRFTQFAHRKLCVNFFCCFSNLV